MRQEIINKLIKVGYTKEQSEEYYDFYKNHDCVSKLEGFADDIIDMMKDKGGMNNEQSLL